MSLACFQAFQHRLAYLSATEAEPLLLLLCLSHSQRNIGQRKVKGLLDLTGAGSDEPRFQPKHCDFETHARPLIAT